MDEALIYQNLFTALKKVGWSLVHNSSSEIGNN